MTDFATQTIVTTLQNLVQNVSKLNQTLQAIVPLTQLSPLKFANLPSIPSAGMIVYITDSTTNTWGATITGGGTNGVLGWFNGTAWTVVGK